MHDSQALDEHIRNPPRRVLLAARVLTAIVVVPICAIVFAKYLQVVVLPTPAPARYAILVGSIIGTVIGGWLCSRIMLPWTMHVIALLDFSIDVAYTGMLTIFKKISSF